MKQVFKLNCKVKRTGSRQETVATVLKQLINSTVEIHFTNKFKINLSFGEKVNLAFPHICSKAENKCCVKGGASRSFYPLHNRCFLLFLLSVI